MIEQIQKIGDFFALTWLMDQILPCGRVTGNKEFTIWWPNTVVIMA